MVKYSWRESTRKVYTTYLKKWNTHSLIHGNDKLDPHPTDVTDFLTDLIHTGAGYKTVNIARCALSAALPRQTGETLGKEVIVGRVVKAAGNKNTPQPRYNRFWNVGIVFDMFRRWGKNKYLDRTKLTLKTTVLLLLLSAQRGQTIWRLNVSGLEIRENKLFFHLKHLLKHNRPGDPLDTVIIPAYPAEKLLCPLELVKEYIKRTAAVRRGHDQLLLITQAPYTPASRDTVSTWTKKTLQQAGIDTNYYKPHSTRGAVTSKAVQLGIDTNILLRQASWRSEETYGRYYNKTIERVDETLAHTVLNNKKKDSKKQINKKHRK